MTFHEPVQLFIGIECCEEHFAEIDSSGGDLITDDIRAQVTEAILNLHRAKPDFRRAVIEPLSIDDPQYIEFKRRLALQPPAGRA